MGLGSVGTVGLVRLSASGWVFLVSFLFSFSSRVLGSGSPNRLKALSGSPPNLDPPSSTTLFSASSHLSSSSRLGCGLVGFLVSSRGLGGCSVSASVLGPWV